MCLDGYNSQANFIDLHREVTAAWDIFIPASIPVVDTLQTKMKTRPGGKKNKNKKET